MTMNVDKAKTALIVLSTGTVCIKTFEDQSWFGLSLWGANFLYWSVILIKELFFDE